MTAPEAPTIHLLNTVFASLTGRDPYLAAQIKSAVECVLADAQSIELQGELSVGETSDGDDALAQPPLIDLVAAISHLRRSLADSALESGFFHFDALALAIGEPLSLWDRQRLLEGLHRLAPHKESTLLVTGLRQAACPKGSRWTRRRRENYDRAVDQLHQLAASAIRPSAKLHIVIF